MEDDSYCVYNVGAIGIDNVRKMPLPPPKKELAEELEFTISESDYSVVTFHPETLNNSNVKEQCQQFLDALSAFPDMKCIITKSNADEGADIINKMMEDQHQIPMHLLSHLWEICDTSVPSNPHP